MKVKAYVCPLSPFPPSYFLKRRCDGWNSNSHPGQRGLAMTVSVLGIGRLKNEKDWEAMTISSGSQLGCTSETPGSIYNSQCTKQLEHLWVSVFSDAP